MSRSERLRAKCEQILGADEHIVLEADANLASNLLPFPLFELGGGRAYLTNERIIWLRHFAGIMFWIPEFVVIRRQDVRAADITRLGLFSGILLRTGDYWYRLRLGKGPFPLLRDIAKTAEEWYAAINA
jgi:hypothetical protein